MVMMVMVVVMVVWVRVLALTCGMFMMMVMMMMVRIRRNPDGCSGGRSGDAWPRVVVVMVMVPTAMAARVSRPLQLSAIDGRFAVVLVLISQRIAATLRLILLLTQALLALDDVSHSRHQRIFGRADLARLGGGHKPLRNLARHFSYWMAEFAASWRFSEFIIHMHH